MTTNPFTIFNRPTVSLTMTRTSGTTGGDYDANDVWVGPTTNTVNVEGHITSIDRDNGESEWKKTTIGPLEYGQMRFFTGTHLQKGDTLQLQQDDGSTTTYRVLRLIRAQRLMNQFFGYPLRYEFEIQEVPR